MRIGEVIGSVTLSRSVPSLAGATWRVVVPLDQDALRGQTPKCDEPLVVFDEYGSGIGSLIGISEGAEATAPFYPEQKPIDAYCAAVLDHVELD